VVGQTHQDPRAGVVLPDDLDPQGVVVLDLTAEVDPVVVDGQIGVVAQRTGDELGERAGPKVVRPR
jgi:hypothetical protein